MIVWNQTSRDIFNFVRSICKPGPEARAYLGFKELKINQVIYLPDAPSYKGIPGAVVGCEKDAFFVKTKDTFVKVTQWSGANPHIGDRFQ